MTNKYLEKIAKTINDDEKKSRGRAWGTLGRTAGFGALGSPIPGGAVAGGIYGYRTGIKKHVPNVPKEELTRQAIGGYARQQGRSLAESVGAGAVGTGVGAGGGALLSKLKKFTPGKTRDVVTAGAIGVGATAATAGAIHGAYKSTKNKLNELSKKYNKKSD